MDVLAEVDSRLVCETEDKIVQRLAHHGTQKLCGNWYTASSELADFPDPTYSINSEMGHILMPLNYTEFGEYLNSKSAPGSSCCANDSGRQLPLGKEEAPGGSERGSREFLQVGHYSRLVRRRVPLQGCLPLIWSRRSCRHIMLDEFHRHPPTTTKIRRS